MENYQTISPETRPRSLTEGGHLLEVPIVRLWPWELWYFDRWLVVTHGSSTVSLPGYFVALKKNKIKKKKKKKKTLPFCNTTFDFHAKWHLRTECRNSMTCHYPDLGSAPEWSFHVGNLLQPIRSTNQIWIVMRHQYWTSALIPRTSFCVETSGGIT